MNPPIFYWQSITSTFVNFVNTLAVFQKYAQSNLLKIFMSWSLYLNIFNMRLESQYAYRLTWRTVSVVLFRLYWWMSRALLSSCFSLSVPLVLSVVSFLSSYIYSLFSFYFLLFCSDCIDECRKLSFLPAFQSCLSLLFLQSFHSSLPKFILFLFSSYFQFFQTASVV